jgi:membrane associated rhomboid family serine protease
MIVLYSFGEFVEFKLLLFFGDLGSFIYAAMYIAAIIIASISTYIKHKDDHYYNSVGASGAVSAIMFSSVVFAPFMELRIYGIIPLPAIVCAFLYVLYSAYMGKRGGDNVNHEAHLWGGFFGMLLTLFLSPSIARDFLTQITSFFR